MKILLLMAISLLLQGCGSLIPIPVHGGGKRFAVEQQLLSAATKKAISDFPIEGLSGKRGYINFSIIHDEGGGSYNGGRPFATEILSLSNNINKSNQTTSTNGQLVDSMKSRDLGINSSRENGQYIKDSTINSSDGRHFINLFNSFLLRNNIFRVVDYNDDVNSIDFSIEIIVDIFGTVWKRSDWGVLNSESLDAIVSYEYVISPAKDANGVIPKVGSSSYTATYKENYIFWMGPSSVKTAISKSDYGSFVGTLGPIEGIPTGSKRIAPNIFQEPIDPTIQIIR